MDTAQRPMMGAGFGVAAAAALLLAARKSEAPVAAAGPQPIRVATVTFSPMVAANGPACVSKRYPFTDYRRWRRQQRLTSAALEIRTAKVCR